MSESKLIRFWNVDIEELPADELKAEIKVQKALRSVIKSELTRAKKKEESIQRARPDRHDKIEFFETYVKELDGLIDVLEEHYEHARNIYKVNHHRANSRFNFKVTLEQYGTGISWDKEKFMLVARDRGYLSEQSITSAMAKELNMELDRARVLLKNGKFTWGQVICVGALLKMNPKEFCDIFLNGYFVEHYGEYIASYQNIDKSVLLKRTTTHT